MDVPGGRVPAGPTSGDGGGDEHPGSLPCIEFAPGHGAQDAGLLGAVGLSATDPPKKPKPSTSSGGALHRRQRPDSGDDQRLPRKQRQTAKRIFERLRGEYGFGGGYTTVKDYVREHRRRTQGDFCASVPSSGHAQCDFDEAPPIIGRSERQAQNLVLDSPHSDGCFIKAYPAETTEAFLDRHVSTFAFLDGVPQGILYDNTKLAMARILGDDGGSAAGRSSSSSPAPCSTASSAARARTTTKARWRAWWAVFAAISWCRFRPSIASTL